MVSAGFIILQTKPRWRKRQAGACSVINGSFSKGNLQTAVLVWSFHEDDDYTVDLHKVKCVNVSILISLTNSLRIMCTIHFHV